MRGEEVNVRVLLNSLLKTFSSTLKGERVADAYVDCFIEKVKPRLIVTFIDNNWNFSTISKRHPEVKTLFVQNGWREYYHGGFEKYDNMNPDALKKCFVDYMLSFGSVIGEEYARYLKGGVVLTGSIKNNCAPKEMLTRRGLMAFVSQYSENGLYMGKFFLSNDEYFGQFDRLIIQSLIKYAADKNKRFVIIPRNLKGSELRIREDAYFKSLTGGEPDYLHGKGLYPSYQAVDVAEVVVALDTTLAYESIARGNKTAIFSIRSSLPGVPAHTYGWPGDFPDEGPFWTNNPNPDSFVRILDYLFEVDDVQWHKDVEDTNFSSLMAYDPGNSALKATLEKELGSPPETKNISPSAQRESVEADR